MATPFLPVTFMTPVQLTPAEMTDGLSERVLEKLKRTYEGVCSRYGYIKPGSLRVLQRSAPKLMKAHFNGHLRYEVIAAAEVCNPTAGTVVEATVTAKNDMGLRAQSSPDGVPVLDIVVPRRWAGIASEIDLDTVAVRDTIFVEVMGKRYQLNDTKISIIGRAVKEMRQPAPPAEGVDDDDATAASASSFDSDDSEEQEPLDGDDDESASGERRRAEAEALRNAKTEFTKLMQMQKRTDEGAGNDDEEDLEEDDDDLDDGGWSDDDAFEEEPDE